MAAAVLGRRCSLRHVKLAGFRTAPVTSPRRVRVCAAFGHGHLAKRPEARANLFGKELWLFPGREVAALVDLVEVDELGVGPFGPGSSTSTRSKIGRAH